MLCNTILLTYFYWDGAILDDELLTIDQVAKELQLHPDTIRRYVRERKLKAVRLSPTNLRIRRSELNRFLKERETDGDGDKEGS